jgi:hypothetical protein
LKQEETTSQRILRQRFVCMASSLQMPRGFAGDIAFGDGKFSE